MRACVCDRGQETYRCKDTNDMMALHQESSVRMMKLVRIGFCWTTYDKLAPPRTRAHRSPRTHHQSSTIDIRPSTQRLAVDAQLDTQSHTHDTTRHHDTKTTNQPPNQKEQYYPRAPQLKQFPPRPGPPPPAPPNILFLGGLEVC